MSVFQVRRQQFAIAIGMLLMILVGLYAPWVGTHQNNDGKFLIVVREYYWVFNAPAGASKDLVQSTEKLSESDKVDLLVYGTWTWEIDWSVLLIEWATIAFATIGALVLLKRTGGRASPFPATEDR